MVQGSEDLLPHASCSSSLWYQVLGISAGFVPSMPLISGRVTAMWLSYGADRRVSQAAPVELGFRLASLRRVYL